MEQCWENPGKKIQNVPFLCSMEESHMVLEQLTMTISLRHTYYISLKSHYPVCICVTMSQAREHCTWEHMEQATSEGSTIAMPLTGGVHYCYTTDSHYFPGCNHHEVLEL